ncbi:hypothetical protein ACFX5Q_15115 [Mesorhizobium sp. IMUNJ 23033]|uniref:hypothetical protein n=1 Tax=Mesorhizobium sp. IMUNJ 23033 TaxID=3378039 RepID=UPI0038508BEC
MIRTKAQLQIATNAVRAQLWWLFKQSAGKPPDQDKLGKLLGELLFLHVEMQKHSGEDTEGG